MSYLISENDKLVAVSRYKIKAGECQYSSRYVLDTLRLDDLLMLVNAKDGFISNDEKYSKQARGCDCIFEVREDCYDDDYIIEPA